MLFCLSVDIERYYNHSIIILTSLGYITCAGFWHFYPPFRECFDFFVDNRGRTKAHCYCDFCWGRLKRRNNFSPHTELKAKVSRNTVNALTHIVFFFDLFFILKSIKKNKHWWNGPVGVNLSIFGYDAVLPKAVCRTTIPSICWYLLWNRCSEPG